MRVYFLTISVNRLANFFGKMAAPYVDFSVDDTKKKHISSSPRNTRKVVSPSSSCNSGHPPMCVCAPATHAGSFKCRLHRTNAHGHSPPSPTLHSQASVQAPSSNTVEAQ